MQSTEDSGIIKALPIFLAQRNTMRRTLPIILVLLFMHSSNIIAEEVPPIVTEEIPPAIVPEPPELPAQIVSGENMSPDITITRQKKETITEYSVNGNVYMVKITPSSGPAYYLVDTDGDGDLETRRSELEKGMNIPQWLLFSW